MEKEQEMERAEEKKDGMQSSQEEEGAICISERRDEKKEDKKQQKKKLKKKKGGAGNPFAGMFDRKGRKGLYDDRTTPPSSSSSSSSTASSASNSSVSSASSSSSSSPSSATGNLDIYRQIKEDIDLGVMGQLCLPGGELSRLLQRSSFFEMVFPGCDASQREKLPNNLKSLMETSPFKEAFEQGEFWRPILLKAKSVMEGAKKRGAEAGEVMDPFIEQRLWKQTIYEAFGREVPKLAQRILRQEKRAYLQDRKEDVASISADQANWDQLENETIEHLVHAGDGFAVLDEYMGEDWIELIQEDTKRFIKEEDLSSLGSGLAQMTWIDGLVKGENAPEGERIHLLIETKYPALAELVKNIRALPFELNKKAGWQLLRPLEGSISLFRYDIGDASPNRLDSGDLEGRAGRSGTDYKLSGAYFIGWDDPLEEGNQGGDQDGGELKLCKNSCRGDEERNARNEREETKIGNIPDRLVLWQSDQVWNARREFKRAGFVILFWMYGLGVEIEEEK